MNTTVDNIVEVDSLHVSFGSNAVLRDINLHVPRGQTVAIIGESGCGKTVLLKTIIGLISPSSGSARFDGHSLTQLNEKDRVEQRMRFGFVFQNSALFDSMTVAQNIAFPLREHGRGNARDIHRIIVARLAEVGLPESTLLKKPAELSGGMRKRVGLARALVMNPDILLYDEPTTGLDPIVGDVINELIIRTRSRYPVTSMVVTHDMKTARKVADRIVMLYPLSHLKQGESQIVFEGTPEEIDQSEDPRVRQFVRGEAGERLSAMNTDREEFENF